MLYSSSVNFNFIRMKKSLILFGVITTLLFSALAYASGPGVFGFFDDIEPGGEEWYNAAAYSMKAMNVVEGIDGNFAAGQLVDRAQMVTMLDRFKDNLAAPKGSEWDEYSNSYYSILYPSNWVMGDWGPATFGNIGYGDISACNSAQAGIGDFSMGVSCFSSTDTSINDRIDTISGSNVVSTEEFIQDGLAATRLITVTSSGFYSQTVLLEGGGMIYEIWGSYTPFDSAFERFVRSFQQI